MFAVATPVVIAAIKSNLSQNMFLWGHTYLTVAYAVILLWAVQNAGSSRAKFLRGRLLREAGRYSYMLYLFHPLFIRCSSTHFFTLWGDDRELVDSWSTFGLAAAALGCSLAFSVVFYLSVERSAVSMGHRSRYEETLQR